MTIRARLLASYIALTAVGMSVLAAYNLASFRDYYLVSSQADLTARAAALSETVADALEERDLARVSLIVARYGAQQGVTLRVFDPQAHLLATSDPAVDGRVRSWRGVPGMADALDSRRVAGRARGISTPDDRLYEARPLVRGGRLLGVLRISLSLDYFQRQLGAALRTSILAIAAAFVACIALAMRLSRSIARPIQAMRDFAVRMGQGRLGERLAIERRDELGDLAAELNGMSERLAALDSERRAFLANVSHELRTPVSNVLVTLEALESGAADDPAMRDRFLRTAVDETSRLSNLVRQLLDLGRLEARVVPLERQAIDLAALVKRAVDALETRLQSKRVRVTMSTEPVVLQVDAERLIQAILNVLDNALKHSPEGERVTVTARRAGGSAELVVQDHGPGIAREDLPHVFEQFYTGDRARRKGGTGLGLAIAHRIVEAHGGTITAASAPGEGATFTIRLPLAPARTDERAA